MIRRCLLLSALCVSAACSSTGVGSGPILPTRTSTTVERNAITTSSESTESTTTIETTTTTTIETTTTTTSPPTTTLLPLVLDGGVVRVANATAIDEAAQQLTEELASLGFALDKPTNAAGKDEELTTSKIYVKAGSEGIAESISYLMGGIEILRMPTPAWIFGGTAALGDTTVLVMLGSDLAGSPLLVMRFEPGRQGPD